jgi:hypothetical protein
MGTRWVLLFFVTPATACTTRDQGTEMLVSALVPCLPRARRSTNRRGEKKVTTPIANTTAAIQLRDTWALVMASDPRIHRTEQKSPGAKSSPKGSHRRRGQWLHLPPPHTCSCRIDELDLERAAKRSRNPRPRRKKTGGTCSPGKPIHIRHGTGLVLIPFPAPRYGRAKPVGFAARLSPTILAMLRCPQLRHFPVHARPKQL